MVLLGIDTSNQEMLLSIFKSDEVLATYMSSKQKNHSTTLMPAIEFLCSSNNITPKELTKIIVSEGPGSYTGLRIAVTTAKTLAYTLGVDLVTVSSLAVIAASRPITSSLIVPIMNARRNNVYSGAYRWNNQQLDTIIEDTHTAIDSWLERLIELDEPVLLVGKDVSLFKETIEQMDQGLFSFDYSHSGNMLHGESFLMLKNKWKKIESVDPLVPNYLKKVEAEEKWLETNQGDDPTCYVERI